MFVSLFRKPEICRMIKVTATYFGVGIYVYSRKGLAVIKLFQSKYLVKVHTLIFCKKSMIKISLVFSAGRKPSPSQSGGGGTLDNF